MSAPFRFGYSGSPFGDVDEIVDVAVRAERAGFDSFVLADLGAALSPLIALAAVARATSTITLGPFVLNTGIWNPAIVARELATLDRVSRGRVEIALGSGIPTPAVRAVMPPTREARFERLVETVDALRAGFDEPGIGPGFAARPRLLVAATGDRAIRLAAERADGVVIAGVPPVPKVDLPPGELVLPVREETVGWVQRWRGYAAARTEPLEVGTSSVVHVTGDGRRVAEEVAAVHTYLTPEQVLRSPKILIGTIEEIAAEVAQRRVDLGLGYLVLRGGSPEELTPVLEAVRGQG
jgi:probable F420-dependent oxidoreductase